MKYTTRTFTRLLLLLPIAALFLILGSCDPPSPPIKWGFSKKDITGVTDVAHNDNLNVDIYIDGTGSMGGFVSPAPTNYSHFLEEIEGAIQVEWKKSDITYNKYGKIVKKLTRAEFLKAQTDKLFYQEAGLYDDTKLDLVVKNSDPKRLSILITDLFYSQNDLNNVVESFKNNCLVNKSQIGIIGLESPFDGYNADVNPQNPFFIKSPARPFYAILIGDQTNIIKLQENLARSLSFYNKNQFLLISSNSVNEFSATVMKDKTSKTINKADGKKGKDEKESDIVYPFQIDAKAEEADMNFEVKYIRKPNTAVFTKDNLKAAVYKKVPDVKDSMESNELDVAITSVTNDIIKGTIHFKGKVKEESFGYAVYLKLDNANDKSVPAWVSSYSADVVDNTHNADRTLDLIKFTKKLLEGNITTNTPSVAKFYIHFHKH